MPLGRRSSPAASITRGPASVFAQIQDAIVRGLGPNVLKVLCHQYNAFTGTRADDILLSYRRWTFWIGQARDRIPLRITFTTEIPAGVTVEGGGEAIIGLLSSGQAWLGKNGLFTYVGVAPEGSTLPLFIIAPGMLGGGD